MRGGGRSSRAVDRTVRSVPPCGRCAPTRGRPRSPPTQRPAAEDSPPRRPRDRRRMPSRSAADRVAGRGSRRGSPDPRATHRPGNPARGLPAGVQSWCALPLRRLRPSLQRLRREDGRRTFERRLRSVERQPPACAQLVELLDPLQLASPHRDPRSGSAAFSRTGALGAVRPDWRSEPRLKRRCHGHSIPHRSDPRHPRTTGCLVARTTRRPGRGGGSISR